MGSDSSDSIEILDVSVLKRSKAPATRGRVVQSASPADSPPPARLTSASAGGTNPISTANDRSSIEPSAKQRSRRPGYPSSSAAPTSIKPEPSSSTAPKRQAAGAKKPPVRQKRDSSEEADALFFRKGPAPKKQARRFNNFAKKPEPIAATVSSSASEQSDSSDTEDKTGTKPLNLPTWTRPMTGAEKKILAEGVRKNRRKKQKGESGSDDDELKEKHQQEEAEKARKAAESKKKGKGQAKPIDLSDSDASEGSEDSEFEMVDGTRKRARSKSKSKSLTPPKALSEFEMAAIMTGVRENIPIPVYVPSDSDSEVEFGHAPSDDVEIIAPAVPDVPESIVEIRVSMVWDPDRESKSEKAKAHYQRWVSYKLGSNKRFGLIYEQVALANAQEESSLSMTYEGHLVYRFGTPASLKITTTADLRCYTAQVYEKLEKTKQLRVEGRKSRGDGDDDSTPSVSREPSKNLGRAVAPGAAVEDESDGEGESQLFHISIRGSQTQVLSLAVKPSITIASLLRKYCKHFGVDEARAAKMWIEFDGEKLDGVLAISTYDDIESEDTIDVREPK